MIAGWVSGFRNRSYLGWLGLAFLCLSGYLLFRDKVVTAHELGASNPGAARVAHALFVASLLAFLLSLVAAVRETARRIRAIQTSHQAAEEALLAMIRAGRENRPEAEREGKAQQGEDETRRPTDQGDG